MVYLQREGQQYGPYPVEQVREMLARGEVLSSDYAWVEGAPDWVPVANLPGLQPAVGMAVHAGGQRRWGLIIVGASVGLILFAGILGVMASKKSPDKKDGQASRPVNPKTGQPAKKSSVPTGERLTFSKVVSPILEKHKCYECHHLDKSGKAKADLDFGNPKSVKTFATPNSKGFPGSAPLVLAVSPNAAKRMPPNSPPLTTQEINIIKGWIRSGLKF